MSAAIGTQLVIFGLSGDLARKKLLPALYRLAVDGRLPEHFRIVGVSRRDLTTDDILGFMRSDASYDQKVIEYLAKRTSMVRLDLTHPQEYTKLYDTLTSMEDAAGTCAHRLFYLSMPPQAISAVITNLGQARLGVGCPHGRGQSRLLVEKPFGYDLESAVELKAVVGRYFREEQIYLIDHYVAKETVQNILTFRFANPLFESVWHGRAVESIIITASEKMGIEGRAVFYDQTGALRDLIQSHLLQLLVLVTMEEPKSLRSEDIHDEKLRLLEAITTLAPDEVAANTVRGQYAGYTDEIGKARSITETFAAVRLQINNDRWRGVPVVLQSGKALDAKRTEVTLVFKDRRTQRPIDNHLTIRIQPNEGIGLGIMVKKPGFDRATQEAEMDFRYERSFGARPQQHAYERVLADAMRGDRSLFSTSESVMQSWRIVDPIVQAWSRDYDGLELYESGVSADDLSRRLLP